MHHHRGHRSASTPPGIAVGVAPHQCLHTVCRGERDVLEERERKIDSVCTHERIRNGRLWS
jgi:hypothetical protein